MIPNVEMENGMVVGTASGLFLLAIVASTIYRSHDSLAEISRIRTQSSSSKRIKESQSSLTPLWIKLSTLFERVLIIFRDFKSGKFYKPWRPSTPVVVVTEKRHVAEYSEVTCLSQQAVYADMFGFKHTMENLEHDRLDHKVVRNRFNNRLLEVKGPAHLEALYPNFLARFEDAWKNALESGRSVKGGVSIPAALVCRRLSTRMISLVFFGEKLTSDEKFIDNLLQYSRDMTNCMMAFQVMPAFLSPYVHWIITRGGRAMRALTNQFTEILDLKRGNWVEAEHIKRCTISHNMATLSESNAYWTGPTMLAQNLLGLWFAASHQPWVNLNSILLEVCARQEWQEALREEIEAAGPLDDYQKLDELPLLDSFMKETARHTPLDTMGVRRKAVLPYKFSDGTISVPQGATICVPAHDMMHDAARYPNPSTFDGARFMPREGKDPRRFTQVAHDFPVWGYGSLACPGRFHATLVIKIAISQLILRYNMSLENQEARRKWSWETFTMPYESTRIVLNQRSSL